MVLCSAQDKVEGIVVEGRNKTTLKVEKFRNKATTL